jgi:hypothetical protein
VGDVAQHLQRRIEQALRDREDAVQQPEREAEAAADREPDHRPLGAGGDVLKQDAARQRVREGPGGVARRR